MKLTDLNGSFYGVGGEGQTDSKTGDPIPERKGMGVTFDCPCGCGEFVAIPFTNPLDGGDPVRRPTTWDRTGETLENLTLKPSLQRLGACRWHGYLTNGEFKSV